MMKSFGLISLVLISSLYNFGEGIPSGEQPLSRIAIHRVTLAIHDSAYVKASPTVLGLKGQSSEWVTLEYGHPYPSHDDWIGVFSPANFNASTCQLENEKEQPPLLCTAPIKYQYACYGSGDYNKTGKGSLKLQLINQRADFSFALFSGGLSDPKLIAVSNKATFVNPNAPVYPRLAQGKSWNEMAVTWTSGYGIKEAVPFVEWSIQGGAQMRSPAGTLTFSRDSMCDSPARTVGWRDPGFIHTSFLKDLWPNSINVAGILTCLDIDYSMVLMFGVSHTALEHLLTLAKTLYSVLLFLVIWERQRQMVQMSIVTSSLVLLTLLTSLSRT